MRRTDLSRWACPLARSLDRVGDWWSMLILRDAQYGLSRFDEFEKSLGIAPNMLTRRLTDLVEAGMLERVPYSQKPLRYDYRLTALGKSFRPVLLALANWGIEQLGDGEPALQLIERDSGRPVRVGMVDLDTGRPINREDYVMRPGPGADQSILARYRLLDSREPVQAAPSAGR